MPTLKIDGREITVEAGTRIIEAADRLGIPIPRFCYHKGLSVAGNCRMCLVETNKSPKLVPSCYEVCQDGLEVKTNTERVKEARRAVLEFILLNHPVDCAICDQAGECDLQDLYFVYNAKPSRHAFKKLHKPKAKVIGPHVILDAERCINCTRCVRFCEEIARAPSLTQVHRGEWTYVDVFPGQELDHPYSMCCADVCPVGALTTRDFRFKCRVWFLKGTYSVCAECSRGCAIRVDTFNNAVQRIVPRYNPLVNNFWACDEGRLAYHRFEKDRVNEPSIEGTKVHRSEAIGYLLHLIGHKDVVVVLTPFLTCEDAYIVCKVIKTFAPQAKIVVGGRGQGFQDDILIRADKNPNRAGLKVVLAGFGLNLEGVGALSTLQSEDLGVLVFGEEHADAELIKALVAKAKHSAIFACTGNGGLGAKAVIPMASPYEVNGTFINEFGVIQRCRKAVEPEGGILPVWRTMKDISEAKGVALMVNNEQDVFEEMKTVCKPLASLHFSDIGEFGIKLEGFSIESSEAKA